MKVVVQRTIEASVMVGKSLISTIDKGILILLGVGENDGEREIEYLCKKISGLRIFDDEQGVMNCSIKEVGGEVLVVSQFTLLANTKKGNRPSYIHAAKSDVSEPLYEAFCHRLSEVLKQPVAKGLFGADMKVSLTNDGPVTIVIDTEENLLRK